jgi:hypothetical protein
MSTRYRVFAILAAAALLFRWEPGIFLHLSRTGNVTWSGWLPVVAAFGVFARPDDVRWLLALYAGIAVDAFVVAPWVPNHYLLTTIVGAAVWAVALAAGRRLGRLPTGDELLADLAGPLQVGVAVFYWFTGFWKSNAGFVDPVTSCGALSWARLDAQFGVLPDGDAVRYAVMAFTLALEWVGPGLLLLPATRAPTAVFFVLFHAVLGLDVEQNYQNFSWAMMPLLSLFVPSAAYDALLARQVRIGAWARANLGVGHATLLLVAWFSRLHVPTFTVQPHTQARWLVSVVCLWVWLGAVAAGVWWARRRADGGAVAPSLRGAPAAWVGLALILLNGLSPVIGYKNRNAWQMYSNVRIEADASNHWLLPPSLDVFGLQRDLVEVVDSDDPELTKTTRDLGLKLTWWDFRVWLHERPYTHATVLRGTERLVISPGNHPAPPPWLLRKLVWFRPVGEHVARQCVW